MKYFLTVALISFAFVVHGQHFTKQTSLLENEYHSGGCIGVCDIDHDGRDDLVILDNSLKLNFAFQEFDGSMTEYFIDTLSTQSQWGMCVGDVDGNGFKDVLCGGEYDGIKYTRVYARDSANIEFIENDSIFMQACNLADVNNDGYLDYFACHDHNTNRLWINDSVGGLRFDPGKVINLAKYEGEIAGSSLNSGSYGSVWTDFDGDGDIDLYIARCKQAVTNPLDPRRINQLWENMGDGTYVESALEHNLVVYEQSWTAEFQDIDNDGDFDCLITNHSNTLSMLRNDGDGLFTNITVASGLNFPGFFLQSIMKDFDNDGYVDLLLAGGTNRYFRNNGDATFSRIDNLFPSTYYMNSCAVGDLNHDGYLDVYASYGKNYVLPRPDTKDEIWMNDGGSNHWIGFQLTGRESNRDAVGAKVVVRMPSGTQVREVRAGESYGITNSSSLHFGLGKINVLDSIWVYWPSGKVSTYFNLPVDHYHQISEHDCKLSKVEISANPSSVLCPGASALLLAPVGYNYLWSNGQQASSIRVDSPGKYWVTINKGDSCYGLSNVLDIEVLSFEKPLISADTTQICIGDTVVLRASDADNYLWSTGEITQEIRVHEPDKYQVSVLNACEIRDYSEEVEVQERVFSSPRIGAAMSRSCEGDTLRLWASASDNYLWSTGESTQEIQVSKSGEYEVFVKNACGLLDGSGPYGVDILMKPDKPITTDGYINEDGVAILSAEGNNLYWYNSQTDSIILFEGPIFQTPVLSEEQSFWVEDNLVFSSELTKGGESQTGEGAFDYAAGQSMIFDVLDDIILESVKVLADTAGEREIVLLGADGNILMSKKLELNAGEQNLELGFFIPQGKDYALAFSDSFPGIWRSYKPLLFAYPYNINEWVLLKSTNEMTHPKSYCYFFDWRLRLAPISCLSERAEARALYTGIEDFEYMTTWFLYPNPSNGALQLNRPSSVSGAVELLLVDMAGKTCWQGLLPASAKNLTIDLHHLPKGAYFLNLYNDQGTWTNQVVLY